VRGPASFAPTARLSRGDVRGAPEARSMAQALRVDSFEPARASIVGFPAAAALTSAPPAPTAPAPAVAPKPTEAMRAFMARFDAADAAGGAWYSDGPNGRNGDLAWGTSYVMMSYVEMFQATGEVRYLDKLAKMSDDVLMQRDSVRGVRDYRGDLKPAWQNEGYTKKPAAWAVHTGMIAAPMVELANVVRKNPNLASHVTYDGQTLAQKAATYIEAGKAAVKAYDGDWRESGNAGYYIFPADSKGVYDSPGKQMPLNQSAAMGTLLVALFDATGEAEWKDKATKLANNLKKSLSVTKNGGYAWGYWPGTYWAPGEDVSHGAITMQFALRAADSGIVFGPEDVKRFVKTLDGQVHKAGKFYGNVGGGSYANASMKDQITRFGVLGKYDPAVLAVLDPILAGRDRFSGSLMLGLAYLARAAA
jgi:hypothetical protein